ncbi:MAG: non-canonical purine NTP diphosphatase [Bacteroidota bacterium]
MIVFATGNPHKVSEVNIMLDGQFEVVSLKDIGCHEDIPETSPTIEGNALQKARYVYQNYGHDCFSEDTGLEIVALNGEPGVYSARYAGEERSAEANMQLVLEKMKDQPDRSARFKTVIALIIGGTEYTFEGVANGFIRKKKSGEGGFGYDPIFEPEGHSVTFAEMSPREKNAISHRGKAVEKLVRFLKKNLQTNQ